MSTEYGLYHIGLKALIRKEDTLLLLRDKQTGHLDLPGGRINADEFEVPLVEILAREIQEELGTAIAYTIEKPLVQYRRYNMKHDMRVFITVYDVRYVSGDIILS